MSSTGRNTAEDLKESMGGITNHGEQRPLEQNAYLNRSILDSPTMRRGLWTPAGRAIWTP
jgi:hypothetical protein